MQEQAIADRWLEALHVCQVAFSVLLGCVQRGSHLSDLVAAVARGCPQLGSCRSHGAGHLVFAFVRCPMWPRAVAQALKEVQASMPLTLGAFESNLY